MNLIDEIEDFTNRIYDKILTKTGLKEDLLIWYQTLIEEYHKNDKIVQYEDIKENMLEKIIVMETKSLPKDKIREYLDSKLPEILKVFKEKKLIDYQMIETGDILPRLIGYNYLEDPEFYIAYRKKGQKEWEGRIPKNIDLKTMLKYINKGYEFEDKNFTSKLLN